MRYEDLSTPVHLLHRAVQKLLKYGMDTFEIYADEVGLAYTGRNRVIAKCKLIAPEKGFREMPIPQNLIGERWNYYTKYMRYRDDYARRLLKVIDESHKTSAELPIKDSDVGRLAKGIG